MWKHEIYNIDSNSSKRQFIVQDPDDPQDQKAVEENTSVNKNTPRDEQLIIVDTGIALLLLFFSYFELKFKFSRLDFSFQKKPKIPVFEFTIN